MNERVRTSIIDIVSCPLFANVIKNNKTSSVMHIIVCPLKTE